MKNMKSLFHYFSKGELALWGISAMLIIASFLMFDRESYLTLTASLIGVTSLIFNAKGNPLGQLLIIVFSVLYGIISYAFSYYGEMITYLGMTAPMAVFALFSWLKNPYKGNRAEVEINRLSRREYLFAALLTFFNDMRIDVFELNMLGVVGILIVVISAVMYIMYRVSLKKAEAIAEI